MPDQSNIFEIRDKTIALQQQAKVATNVDLFEKQICLFDANTIDSLEWPENEDGTYAKSYLTSLIKNGISHYIENIHAKIFALKIDHFVFPIIVVEENYNNSWVCSPYAHYISFGKESLHIIDNPILSRSVKGILNGLGKLSQFGNLNSIVYVNNWLFSTDLYPAKITSMHISLITDFLKKRFPNLGIIFRSLNPIVNNDLMQSLKDEGYKFVASRQVYISDSLNEEMYKTRIIKSDLKLWREKTFEVIDCENLSSQDYNEALKLHNMLYTDKSSLQPKYTKSFIQLLFDQKLLSFKILKINGLIKGVAGYLVRNKVMHSPLFGYDKNDPQHTLIYRVLSISLMLEAKKKGVIFHQSAGASFYKKIRRAESCLESIAIYTKHLPIKQKITWKALKFFINIAAPKYMKKY